MSLETVTCVVASCDDCGDGWADEDYRWHYTSEDEARRSLTGDLGWETTPAGGLRCRPCAAARACAEHGHLWMGWWLCRCRGLIQEAGHSEQGCAWQVRYCERCNGAVERRRVDVSALAEGGAR